MIITGISPLQFAAAVEKAGVLYADNLRTDITRVFSSNRLQATVKLKMTGYGMGLPTEELAPGQKRSIKWSGERRVAAVCWHVYRDVLIEVFNINPDAKVRTQYAKYLGKESFYEEFPKTAHIDIGSPVMPVTPVECCDC
jgi:hypothetical protein